MAGEATFSTTMPALAVGHTYRFLMGDTWYSDGTTDTHLTDNDILRFTADGSTEYTTGITRVGSVGTNGSYVDFAIAADAPALEWYNDQQGIGSAVDAGITGIATNAMHTDWNKALDFSGNAERTLQANSNPIYTPLKMAGSASTVANSGYGWQHDQPGHPWATAVFKVDGHSSNQHIWNLGEGSGDNDDNIYLRLDANRNLYFGWGRSGALNELFIGSSLSTSQWYGAYIAHNGTRLNGANATAANLADCFDIRLYSSVRTGRMRRLPTARLKPTG